MISCVRARGETTARFGGAAQIPQRIQTLCGHVGWVGCVAKAKRVLSELALISDRCVRFVLLLAKHAVYKHVTSALRAGANMQASVSTRNQDMPAYRK